MLSNPKSPSKEWSKGPINRIESLQDTSPLKGLPIRIKTWRGRKWTELWEKLLGEESRTTPKSTEKFRF